MTEGGTRRIGAKNRNGFSPWFEFFNRSEQALGTVVASPGGVRGFEKLSSLSLVIFRIIFRMDPLWQGERAGPWRSLRTAAEVALRPAPGSQPLRTPDSNHRTSNGSILTLLQTSAVCARMRDSAQGTSEASEQLPARSAVVSALLPCDLMPQRSMISASDRPDL